MIFFIQGAEGREITSDRGQVSGKLNISLMDLVVADGRESSCSLRVRGHKSIRAGPVLWGGARLAALCSGVWSRDGGAGLIERNLLY